MSTIDVSKPTPTTAGRSARMVRPLVFAVPLVVVLAVAVLAYSRGSQRDGVPGAAEPAPSVVGPPPGWRLTPAKADLPTFPPPAELEARAAQVAPADRVLFGINPERNQPLGWYIPGVGNQDAGPVFEYDGTKLLGFSVINAKRLVTPAEYYDPAFDPEDLRSPEERAGMWDDMERMRRGEPLVPR